MGLEGLGDDGGDGGGDFSAPALADNLENVGTNEQNANVLNLFLSGASLLIGGPKPISQARTTEPVKSIVFNNNFSRERYGKAAVQDIISLDSDKRSLLLDNNQTEEQKALSFISALEFDNGLTVVQNMSNTDVTNRDQPNLDEFESYPESMFNNAALLNESKETFVFDAIAASTDATQAFTSFQ
jgi:hypothetical protein